MFVTEAISRHNINQQFIAPSFVIIKFTACYGGIKSWNITAKL